MARFYTNENIPLPVAAELRKLGNDILTIQETGKANQAFADEDLLEFAGLDGRIVLTLNRIHFIKLHSKKPNHAGVVVCSFDPDFGALAKRIHTSVLENEPMQGKLIRVNRPVR